MASIPRDTSKSSIELRSYTDGLPLDPSNVEAAHSVPNIQGNGEETGETNAKTSHSAAPDSKSPENNGRVVKGDAVVVKAEPSELTHPKTPTSKAQSECTVFMQSDPDAEAAERRNRHQSGPSKFQSPAGQTGQTVPQNEAINRDPDSNEHDRMLTSELTSMGSEGKGLNFLKSEYVGKRQETFGGLVMGFLLATALIMTIGMALSIATSYVFHCILHCIPRISLSSIVFSTALCSSR